MPVTPVFRSRLVRPAMLAITLLATLTPCSATAVLAADQSRERRQSLIHRPAVESPALPAPSQGTMVQPLSDQPPRLTSRTGPVTQHRKLAKRPAIASTAAPAPSSLTQHPALISGAATGQITQATTDTTKATTPPATAPMTKPTTNPLSGATSTGASTAAPQSSTPSPLTHTATASPVASPGSGSAPSFGGSRSALNLLQNAAIASLLQALTPVVSTPPALPPSPTPPSTPPSSSPSTGNVTLTWAANREPDLAGYQVYVGTTSGTYSFPGSPFMTGIVTSYTVSTLPNNQTYFFAMSAYDSAGNESGLSAEVSKSLY